MQSLDIENYPKVLKDKFNIPTEKITYFVRWVSKFYKENHRSDIFLNSKK